MKDHPLAHFTLKASSVPYCSVVLKNVDTFLVLKLRTQGKRVLGFSLFQSPCECEVKNVTHSG